MPCRASLPTSTMKSRRTVGSCVDQTERASKSQGGGRSPATSDAQSTPIPLKSRSRTRPESGVRRVRKPVWLSAFDVDRSRVSTARIQLPKLRAANSRTRRSLGPRHQRSGHAQAHRRIQGIRLRGAALSRSPLIGIRASRCRGGRRQRQPPSAQCLSYGVRECVKVHRETGAGPFATVARDCESREFLGRYASGVQFRWPTEWLGKWNASVEVRGAMVIEDANGPTDGTPPEPSKLWPHRRRCGLECDDEV
jgi:hypothetical protein